VINLKKVNPIIIREMRGRMRGRRAFIVLGLYLLLLSCVVGSVYSSAYSGSSNYHYSYNITAPSIQYGPTIGKTIFASTILLLLLIISHVAPAFTAGAITGEREQKTYEALIITPLRAHQIVWGKLGSVFTFMVLLMLASLPVQSLAFLFGGVALEEVLIAALALTMTALAFGALGLYVSSLTRTTAASIIITYGLLLPFLYGLPFMLGQFLALLGPLFSATLFFNNTNLTTLGAVVALLVGLLMLYGGGFLLSINPFSAAIITALIAANGDGYFFFSAPVGPGLSLWFVSPWVVYVIFYALFTLLLMRLTARRLARVDDR
jgi:ABC-type transport system involved in multi-copper enzyme maturation permease subunit